ncbi:hypothetical protein GQ472_06155 [archaeon]|nr:hypothetical protein [archaeon]
MADMTDAEVRDRFDRLKDMSGGRPFMLCVLKGEAVYRGRKIYNGTCKVCGRAVAYSDVMDDSVLICRCCIMKIDDLDDFVDEVQIPCLGLKASKSYGAS